MEYWSDGIMGLGKSRSLRKPIYFQQVVEFQRQSVIRKPFTIDFLNVFFTEEIWGIAELAPDF